MHSPKRLIVCRKGLRDLGIPFCDVQLREMERNGLFPKRFNLSPHRIAWWYDEIVAYLEDCLATRDAGDDTSP